MALIGDCDDNGETMTKAKASTTTYDGSVDGVVVAATISTAICYSLNCIDMRISLFIHSTIRNGQGYALKPLPHRYVCFVVL